MADIEQRVRGFISCVRAHAGLSTAQLASRLSVSSRTVRNYALRASGMLEGAASIRSDHGRWALDVIDEHLLRMRVDSAATRSPAGVGSMPGTRHERVAYLLSDLLSRAGWITVDELSSILFITRRTVSADLKLVESALKRFGLVLQRRPRYGIRVDGPEMGKRLCLANLIVGGFSGSPGASVRAELIDTVAGCATRTLQRTGLEMSSAAFQNLLVHVCIAVLRIQEGRYVPMEADQLSTIVETREYRTARELAADIERRLDLELPREEIAYIAIHLAGKQMLCAADEDGSGVVIREEVWTIVGRMLERVWRAFRFDFRGDLEVRMNLACHIVPLSVRLTYRMSLHNPLLADIKMRYPLAYSMATDAGSVLSECFETTPSEDEIGYLALAFALAIERQKTSAPKKGILVVCASGQGSARLLKYRYQQEFGSYVDRIVTCDASHVASIDLSGIDYVFTTVPLPLRLPVPVREVKYFLDAGDIEAVRELLTDRGASESDDADLFDPALFFAHMPAVDKESAISFLCERAREATDLPECFEQMVWERERAAATAFGDMVALPHPMRALSDRTFVVAGISDREIDWSGQPVRAVFLIVIARTGHDELEGFFMRLARLFTNGQAIQELLANPTYGRLLELTQTSNEGNRS